MVAPCFHCTKYDKGCGLLRDKCPDYISYREEIERIREIKRKEGPLNEISKVRKERYDKDIRRHKRIMK